MFVAMRDLDMFVFDVCSAVALLVVALVGAYLPMKLYTGGGRSLWFQLGSMFSGGVMLSAGFCHLLADALEVLQEEIEDFPVGPFLCASGFLVTLMVDQIAEDYGTAKSPDESTANLLDEESAHHEDKARVPFYTAILLTVSLCLHSILEGLALGTDDDIESSINIAVAILAHKGMAAYALGACVIDSKASNQMFWTILGTFSMASPVGVMIGYAISEYSDSVTSSALTALASGTFLYVAMMEVIPNELQSKGHKLKKLAALIIGFGLMSMIAIWA